MEVPDANWIAQCADPQGAIFALAGRRGFGYFKGAGASSESLLQRIRSAMHSDARREAAARARLRPRDQA
jgi:hypothetical protein